MNKPKGLRTFKKTKSGTWRKKGTGKDYGTTRWRKLRQFKIEANPECEICFPKGFYILATVVDHIQPVNDGGDMWDYNNLQSLCTSCHNRKTGIESRHGRTQSNTQ